MLDLARQLQLLGRGENDALHLLSAVSAFAGIDDVARLHVPMGKPAAQSTHFEGTAE